MTAPVFNYRCFDLSYKNQEDMEKTLNSYGLEGWELIFIDSKIQQYTMDDYSVAVILKRQVIK